MTAAGARRVLIAGAGLAGLTAALALARRGFEVRIFERAEKLEQVGAGLQLSPNATRILDRLGVLERLRPLAVAPEAIVLRDAKSLRELARVPLGRGAEERWGAPYVVAHRADLQKALLAAVEANGHIECFTGAEVRDFVFAGGRIEVFVTPTEGEDKGATPSTEYGSLLVGADGVWSRVRQSAGLGRSRFTGELAWRVTVAASDIVQTGLLPRDAVTAFLHPGVHLVTYPVRAGTEINLVAVTKGGSLGEGWDSEQDPQALYSAFDGAHRELLEIVKRAGAWLPWPLHAVEIGSWTRPGGLALVGDAAHAMTPFAAQGAAMAIEDAAILADAVAATPDDIAGALTRYEKLRRPRIARVARRGALNHLAWHARGTVALARNLVLGLRSPERLMADMDWLYGWSPGETDGGVTGG